jgi:hypothetical protein
MGTRSARRNKMRKPSPIEREARRKAKAIRKAKRKAERAKQG